MMIYSSVLFLYEEKMYPPTLKPPYPTFFQPEKSYRHRLKTRFSHAGARGTSAQNPLQFPIPFLSTAAPIIVDNPIPSRRAGVSSKVSAIVPEVWLHYFTFVPSYPPFHKQDFLFFLLATAISNRLQQRKREKIVVHS